MSTAATTSLIEFTELALLTLKVMGDRGGMGERDD
jgi:hypothetical protein